MTRLRLRATTALLATLVIGLALGVAGDRVLLTRGAPISMGSPALITEMDRRLHLDTAQRTAITAILSRHQATVDSAWKVVQPSVRAAMSASQMEILDVLHPDQRAPYLAWLRVAHRGMGSVGQ